MVRGETLGCLPTFSQTKGDLEELHLEMMASRLQIEVAATETKGEVLASQSNDCFQKGDISDSATPETGDGDNGRETSGKWKEERSNEQNTNPSNIVGEGDVAPGDSESASPQTQALGSIPVNEQAGQHTTALKSVDEQQKAEDGESHEAPPAPSGPLPTTAKNNPQLEDPKQTWNDHNRKRSREDESHSEISDYDDDSDDDDHIVWKMRLACGKVVNNEYIQVGIIILIIINSIMMGIATFDFVTEDEMVDLRFDQVDKAFLAIFTVEVGMQLIYLGVALFGDGWLVFDFFIVIFSWSFESLQVVRAFRIFRAFRLITRVKPLRDLVLAIGAVLPRMYAIGALLVLIFYIYAVLFTELFRDVPMDSNYFRTLDASLFTCMEMMTLEWAVIAREVMHYHTWAWAPFLTFIAMTGFIVFNLIVAVVCDAVAVTEKTVRQLEGLESDNPVDKLEQAQERIDLLQCHISDMLRTQQTVQDMIEIMAGEMLFLDSEVKRSEQREADLRIMVERRKTYQKSMESERQIHIFERNAQEDQRRKHTITNLRRRGSRNRLMDDESEQGSRRSERRKLERQLSRSSKGSSKSLMSDL